MDLVKEERAAALLHPARRFACHRQAIEYRVDPLTGSQSRLNLGRSGRVKQTQRAGPDLSQVIEDSRAGCFFCPDSIEGATPRFPPELYAGGRITRGECVVFPNLFPFGEYHAVGTLTRQHYLQLDEFTTDMLVDNLMAAAEYVALVHERDSAARYPMWIWNYLPPSGASIIHPHVQIVIDRDPTPGLATLFQRSNEYRSTHESSYWHDLVREEKTRWERFIGENDSVYVIASYAPRGNRDIQFVFRRTANLADLNEEQAKGFADAVIRILKCYKEMGVNSFNLVTYSGPTGENPDHYLLNARIVSRPWFQPWYTADCGFMERFFDGWVIETLPEDVARSARQWFRAS